MAKHKDREVTEALYQELRRLAAASGLAQADFAHLAAAEARQARELRKMKKFRFQLLHRWLVARFAPCRAADIGGDKGLLAYLLQQSGWDAVVVDPVYQPLPDKYKDIGADRQMKLDGAARVPHIDAPFTAELGARFDLLIGLHAHGCNAAVIDAAAESGCGFVLFPCCVIDEPLLPLPGIDWLACVAQLALQRGLATTPFRLNFKGQHIGLYHVGEKVGLVAK